MRLLYISNSELEKVNKYNKLFRLAVIIMHLRMKEHDERELFLTEKISNVAYNTRYNLLKFFEEYDRNNFAEPNDIIYILGNNFQVTPNNAAQTQQKIYDIFQSTPWLTYRSGFP